MEKALLKLTFLVVLIATASCSGQQGGGGGGAVEIVNSVGKPGQNLSCKTNAECAAPDKCNCKLDRCVLGKCQCTHCSIDTLQQNVEIINSVGKPGQNLSCKTNAECAAPDKCNCKLDRCVLGKCQCTHCSIDTLQQNVEIINSVGKPGQDLSCKINVECAASDKCNCKLDRCVAGKCRCIQCNIDTLQQNVEIANSVGKPGKDLSCKTNTECAAPEKCNCKLDRCVAGKCQCIHCNIDTLQQNVEIANSVGKPGQDLSCKTNTECAAPDKCNCKLDQCVAGKCQCIHCDLTLFKPNLKV